MVGPMVTVSTGVMNSLLPKLSALIDGEYKLLSSVKGGISFLRDELSSMNALLLKLANNEESLDVQRKEWRNKVRELSYDIEDCIDLFLHKLKRGDANANIAKRTARKIKKLWSRHKITKIIEGLKARVKDENERHLRYKVEESDANMSTIQIDPRLPALYVEADRLVGIDGPREKIIEWMNKDDSIKKLRVVSIVGFGGLGKTTLANQVFNKIKAQFDSTAFVPVSRNPMIKKILTDMLKELGSSVDTSDDERQLINKLRAHLQDKRYLIVVDDIWSKDAWKSVKSALPENSLCSRIITTTRLTDVAQSCCSCLEGYVHKIQPLSDEDSKKLFYKRVFRSEHSCPPHLEEVSQAIIKKCHGLPLAIITIASLLANKNSDAKYDWEGVEDSMASALNSEKVGDILLLSYYDLPYHLKTCFLYLSVFPEDYRIPREELIWMWIAEGFITQMKGYSLEQIGENYFNDLINRSLIQPIGVQYDGRAYYCRVHDMVLDLIISLSTQENFMTRIEEQEYKSSSNSIRRLSLLSNCVGKEVMQEIMEKCLHIPSLVILHGLDKHTPHISKFQYLRVLVLEPGSGHLGNQHIKYIGSFIQLKYLEIRGGITELPDQIGNLQNLQTLDIGGSLTIKKLPLTIGRLQNLVRLLTGDLLISVHVPDEIGNLQALQVLSFVSSYNSVNFAGQLRRLTNLRVLGMRLHGSAELGDHDMGRYQEALQTSLTLLGKHGLKSLEIECYNYPAADKLMDSWSCDAPCLQKLVCRWGFFRRIPPRMVSLVNLAHLEIWVEQIKQEDLCILGGIPTLLYVTLESREAPGGRLTIGSQQFYCLKEFNFNSNGKGGLRMVCEQEAMPTLRSLRLHLHFSEKEAESEIGFEFSFEHLASLEQLNVRIVCVGATRSRVEAAEAAIRNTVGIHPGRPTLEISRYLEEHMVEDDAVSEVRPEDGCQ
uniref:Uncharacterized protein n=1 Tax=Arundo donax TaxID=35708 RepID=A0A0A9BBB9_ARUDO